MSGIIGIYGGTFDPPHLGHVKYAKAFIEEIKPKKLIIIPDYIPPHKRLEEKSASASSRYEMCRIAFSDFADVSDWEISRKAVSYTVDTVTHFSSLYPSDEIYLLIGDDMLSSFTSWYRYRDILAAATLCVANRSGLDEAAFNSLCDGFTSGENNAKIVKMNFKPDIISSSTVRNGKNKALVPEGVRQYIKKEHLYGML